MVQCVPRISEWYVFFHFPCYRLCFFHEWFFWPLHWWLKWWNIFKRWFKQNVGKYMFVCCVITSSFGTFISKSEETEKSTMGLYAWSLCPDPSRSPFRAHNRPVTCTFMSSSYSPAHKQSPTIIATSIRARRTGWQTIGATGTIDHPRALKDAGHFSPCYMHIYERVKLGR